MLHAREDYNRIQDPEMKIGETEPVFLLRAKDKHAPATLDYWSDLVDASGNKSLANKIRQWAEKMRRWQECNTAKIPDDPEFTTIK